MKLTVALLMNFAATLAYTNMFVHYLSSPAYIPSQSQTNCTMQMDNELAVTFC